MAVEKAIEAPVKKPKAGNLVINEHLAIWAVCQDPWYKIRRYMRLLPPWSKRRAGYAAIKERPAMFAATETFKKAAHATKGMERWARREAISRALKGKDYGGKKKVLARKVSVAEALAAIRNAGVIVPE